MEHYLLVRILHSAPGVLLLLVVFLLLTSLAEAIRLSRPCSFERSFDVRLQPRRLHPAQP